MELGLTSSKEPSTAKHIDYSMYVHANNHLYTYLNGAQIGSSSAYQVGDKIWLILNKNRYVEFWQRSSSIGINKLMYTSKQKLENYPLHAVVKMYSGDTAMKSIRWVGDNINNLI